MGYSLCLRGMKSSLRGNMKDPLLGDELSMDMVVPKGSDMRRFVIPTSYLCLPVFRPLMERMAEEFGFDQAGGLQIPCEEDDFKELLQVMKESRSAKKKKTKMKCSVETPCSA